MTPRAPEWSDAELLEPGRRYRRPTGVRHVFRLPADWMTVAFLIASPAEIETEFPRYRLESTDGAYAVELSAKHDLLPQDGHFAIRFEHLLPGKLYTLTRKDDVHVARTVFSALPFLEIVDQPREMHAALDRHAYAVPLEAAAGAEES